MKPSQLSLTRYVGAPTLHPSGENAVVAVRRIDLENDEYPSQLWLVPTDDTGGSAGSSSPAGGPRQLTFGGRDAAPAYSPDGKSLAFLRSQKDSSGKPGKAQLWVMPTSGGEARRVTDNPLGVESIVWSGDSTRIAYLARVPEDGRYGTVEGNGADKEAAAPDHQVLVLPRRHGLPAGPAAAHLGDRRRRRGGHAGADHLG